jgi:hypothetical protein
MFQTLGTVILLAMTASAAVKIEKTSYGGWPNCYRITNGEVELIVTSDVGPRVIRYGFAGGQNLFKEFKESLGKHGESDWQPRGGHRVWMAPEVMPDTYALDNGLVQIQVKGDTIEATQPVEKETGLQKQMIVRMAASGSNVEVTHRITNRGKPREFTSWGLTMMAQGGLGITGFPPRGTHPQVLAPTNPLVMWAYTDFTDPRWKFTKKYLTLRQDPNNKNAQKIGHFNAHTFGAYLLGSDLFIKRYDPDPKGRYPDFGCSFETFTNNEFLEIETLGALAQVPTGGSVQHTERWSLHRNVKLGAITDAELDRVLLPLLGR